jgi:hypothetical protein
MKNNTIGKIFFLSIITILLTLGFYNNTWKIVDQERFDNYDIYCQSQIIGRVIKAEKDGILSKAGLTGWVRDKDMTWDEMLHYQYEVYQNERDIDCNKFVFYDGQIGGQGMVFALIDKISPFNNALNLKLFWLLTSLTLAFLLAVFIYWVYKNYGFYASIITFILILISPWLTIFGKNLYWVIGSFYFPFIFILVMFYKESGNKLEISNKKLILSSFLLVFTKLFFSGFELITTFLVMFSVPLFYYFFLNKWKLDIMLKRLLSLITGSIIAFIMYTVIFTYQLSTVKGSISAGIEHMVFSFLKRTSGNSADFPEVFKASLESNVFDVINFYFKSSVIEFGFIKVKFLELIYILLVFTIIAILPHKISKVLFKNREKNLALILTTWISILAPLSWFIIFKAHSYIHLGYNDISLFMPFCLFGFALIGSITISIGNNIIPFIRSKRN